MRTRIQAAMIIISIITTIAAVDAEGQVAEGKVRIGRDRQPRRQQNRRHEQGGGSER
jgi:hypothetical protein